MGIEFGYNDEFTPSCPRPCKLQRKKMHKRKVDLIMITQALLTIIFTLVSLIISLFPEIPSLNLDTETITSNLSIAFLFFPHDLWVLVIANIVFWLSSSFVWSVIEWIYKKIPGVE